MTHRRVTAPQFSRVETLEGRQLFADNQLRWLNIPGDAAAGQSLGNLQVAVVDMDGHLVSNEQTNVTVVIRENSGKEGAVLNGTQSVPTVNGIATFTDLNITTAGNYYILEASSDEGATEGTNIFNITAGPTAALTFDGMPTGGVANSTLHGEDAEGLEIHAVDKYGNLNTLDNSIITIAATGPDTLDGTMMIPAYHGVANFTDLALEKAGEYTLTAAEGKITAVSDAFQIVAGSPDYMTFMSVPKVGVAGALSPQIVVNVYDGMGNLCNDWNGEVNLDFGYAANPDLDIDPLTVNASGGVATFDGYELTGAGSYLLAARVDGVDVPAIATTTVVAGPSAGLEFLAVPDPLTVAGAPLNLSVKVVDEFGNQVLTDKTTKVTISLSENAQPEGAKLLGVATVAAVGGLATFKGLNLPTTGEYRLNASATLGASTPVATTSEFNVVAGVAAKLAWDVAPSATTAGVKMEAPRIILQDKFGNTVTDGRTRVSVAALTGPAGATLGPIMTVRSYNGQAGFANLALTKAGNYAFRVTAGKLILNSPPVPVAANEPAKIAVISGGVAANGNQMAGTLFPKLVGQLQDRYGNVVDSDNESQVTVSVASGMPVGGTLSTTVVKGVFTYADLRMATTGGYFLKFNSGDIGAGRSTAFNIIPGPAAKLYVPVQPDDMVAGETINPIGVFVLDTFNNQVTNYPGTIVASVQGGVGAKLTGTVSVKATGGFAGFENLSTTLAGNDTLTFTAGPLKVVTDAFKVSPDVADAVLFDKPPVATKAGVALAAVTAKIVDQYGNLRTEDDSEVSINTIDGPVGAEDLDGTTTKAANNGVVTFNDLKLTTAGSYKLEVATEDTRPITSAAFVVSPNAAAKLSILEGPTDTVAGTNFTPISVQVLDTYGNVVTTDASKVTAAIVSGSGATNTLLGTATVAAAKGIAKFAAINITAAGEGYKLKFTDGTLATDTSEEFAITHAAANKLTFVKNPKDTKIDEAIAPAITVAVQDKFGNLVDDSAAGVTLSLAKPVTGVTVGGTATQLAVDGVATFDDITLNTIGSYQLKAASGALVFATSPIFKVTA